MEDLDPLVAAARAGGGWAFGRLWELLAPSVARYLRTRGVRDVDDVTSEVFLAAFRSLDGFDGDGSAFRAWLFTIAHHKRVDLLRRPVREVFLDTDEASAASVDSVADDSRGGAASSAEDLALRNLAHEDVERMLATLTDEQRSVLLLRVVGDLSLAEVADVLGKPVGAVKALQHRALARLRRQVESSRLGVSPNPARAMRRTR